MTKFRMTFRRQIWKAIHETHHAHGFNADRITAAVMKLVNAKLRERRTKR